MPLPLKVDFDLHGSVEEFLLDMKQKLKPEDQIVLVYCSGDPPYAKLIGGQYEFDLPLPRTPGIYGTWKAWLKEYLEDQINVVSEDTRIKVWVMAGNGDLRPLYSKVEAIY